MPSTNPNNHEYRIVGKGVGLKNKTQPLSVRFPPDIMETLKSRTDTQDFVRAAVVEKLEREAALPCSEKEAIDPTSIPPAPTEPSPKKPRIAKPKPPYWLTSYSLYSAKNLSAEDMKTVRSNPDSWFLVNEPRTKVTKLLDMKSRGEYRAMLKAERETLGNQ